MNRTQSQLKFTQPQKIPSRFVANPIRVSHELTKTDIRILDCIAHLEAKYKDVWASQSKIATIVGCGRQYVNERIKKLAELGLIHKSYQAYTTCNYKISGFLKLRPVIVLLKDHIPNLKYFYSVGILCVSMLMSGSKLDIAGGKGDTTNTANSDLVLRLTKTKTNLTGTIGSTTRARETSINEEVKKVYSVFEESGSRKSDSLLKFKLNAKKRSEEREVNRSSISKKGDDVTCKDVFVYGKQKLSVHGLIELTCFPDGIVAQAYRELCTSKDRFIREPLAYMYGICEKMCRAKNIELDYERKRLLKATADCLPDKSPWIDATPEEQQAHVEFKAKFKLSQDKNNSKEKDNSPSRKAWEGHYNEHDEIVTIRHTAEEVKANVETIKDSPLFSSLAGILPEDMFKDEMVQGKEYQRSTKELELQKKRQARYPAYSKSQPESITLKEKQESNTNAREYNQTFNQIDLWQWDEC
jgi:DNA-binding Lrp family transcriptional regulator